MAWIQQAGVLHELKADGVTAEGRVVFAKAVLEIITGNHIATVAVNVGGAGYVVGEEFDIVGGTAKSVNGVSFFARGRVTSVAGGVVTGVELLSAGSYSVNPSLTGLTTANSTAAGNNALTVDITMQTAYWTLDSSSYTDLLTNFEWLCTSTKVSNPPTIGMQSQLSGANDGVRMIVATSYDGLSSWLGQPGAPTTPNIYCAIPNQDPNVYISTTERRVNVMVTDGTSKQYMGLGLFIPFVDVDSNYPFPGLVHGQSTSVQAFISTWSTSNAGIINPGTGGSNGPYLYRNNLSTEWFGITDDNNQSANPRAIMWPRQGDFNVYSYNIAPVPTGSLASTSDMDPDNSNFGTCYDFNENDWLEGSASQGPAAEGATGQLHFTIQAIIISSQTADTQMIGLIDGYEHVHLRGLNAFDEIRTAGGRRFLVFQDTNTTNLGYGVAMEKL